MQAITFKGHGYHCWALPWKTVPWWILLGGIMATLAFWFVNNTPEVARCQTFLVMLMLLTDSVTGVVAAGLGGKISSHRMRTRFIAKCAQYTGLVALATAPSLLLKNWLPIELALTALIMFESISIVENMRKLETVGGVNLGPARPLIALLSKFLDVPPDAPVPPERLVITPQEDRKEKDSHENQHP